MHFYFCYALFSSHLKEEKYDSFHFYRSIVLDRFLGMKPLHSTQCEIQY